MKRILIVLLLGIFLISITSAELTDNITAYYQMDDDVASTNVIDRLIFNNGTLVGGDNTEDISAAGIIDKSLDLNGIDDYVDTNITGSYENISIGIWAFLGVAPAAEQYIFGQTITLPNNKLFMVYNTDGTVDVQSQRDGGTTLTTSTSDISSSGWTYFVYTEEKNGNAFLYVNGAEVDNTTVDNSDLDFGIQPLYIGARNNVGSAIGFYDGRIDEIGIWNRSVTPAEVLELYNSGNGLTYPFTGGTVAVTLISPLNDSTISGDVIFNATLLPPSNFDLTNGTLFIWTDTGSLFLDITNIVLGNTSNTTNFLVDNLTTGNYIWNVLGVASNGTLAVSNFSENNRTFTWVPFEVDNEQFNTDVFETSRQDFLLNITTLASVLSIDAILNYNGTRFTAETSCSSGLCEISTAIDIPLVSSGEFENKTFFWEISVFDGTISFSTNLTENQQNVTRLHLEVCDATFTVQTLNFTSFDEETEAPIDPFTFDASFNFWLGTGSIKRDKSLSNSSTSSVQLCLTPTFETLFLDGTIQYNEAGTTNYTNRNYFFQNDTISNSSQDIELGLLLSEDSTSFILKVQDRDILPVANVLIFTERFYPGQGVFRVVQVSETDDNGATVGFFQTETVEYRFILKQNGATVLTTNKQKIVGESVPFTLTFTIGEDEGAAWEPFEEIDNLTSEITFNKTSSIVSFTYLDTSGNFELARLIVEKVNASALQNNIICSETSTQSSATITCNLTGNSTGQYIARGIITRSGVARLVEQGSFAIEDFSTIAGRLGLFMGWFIILISVFAFKFNEVAGIILVNLAIIFVNLIGIIAFGYVFISAMIAISIIILVVLER